MPDLHRFPEDGPARITEVGGKAASLIRLLDAGFPVPPGVVLTTTFFSPWYESLKQSAAWTVLAGADESDWTMACEEVKAEVPALALTADQQATIDAARAHLGAGPFAVRSSSPEEDLSGASFAGGYETRLGVAPDALEEAVRHCFASSLDARVLHYKREQGFDPLAPRIAVVVQQLVDADVAGVGFSLNPLTNDYDEAVVDAAWGLGEALVSGAITPDHFVVNKVSGEVLTRDLGAKQNAGDRSDRLCLTDDQLQELTRTLTEIEALYEDPVDIEWAYDGGTLHVLQARPVTAWVPLPDRLITAPGERRRLYMDMALTGGFAINAPITPIGESWFGRFAGLLVERYFGKVPVELGPHDMLWFLTGGRMYQDLSNVLWISTPWMLALGQDGTDPLLADTLRNIDGRAYRSATRPAWVAPWVALAYPRAVWRMRGLLLNVVRSVFAPTRARARYDQEIEAFESEFAAISPDLTISELIAAKADRVIQHVIETTMPGLILALGAQPVLDKLIPRRHRDLAEKLSRGYEGNVVVEMGGALHRMAGLLTAADRADPERLAGRLEARDLPEPFLAAWDDFLATYGWRGPHEVDLGSPRYADEPLLALRQLCAMGDDAEAFDPVATQARHAAERFEAYERLLSVLGIFRRLLVKPLYRLADLFVGKRDTPKHEYLLFFAALRRRAMHEGRLLAEAGRLDTPEHVLDLRIEEIEAGIHDEGLDLRAMRARNRAFIDRLGRLVKGFPPVIDSRGRILRPAPKPEQPGELRGVPISPGVVRGPATVLHGPHDKPVRPGEILVAHTTDPGWTPLFVNAAAVVLGVGGMLQHGAVVAREYGKPCVAGISELVHRIEDGQMVEVDGTEGVVRIIEG